MVDGTKQKFIDVVADFKLRKLKEIINKRKEDELTKVHQMRSLVSANVKEKEKLKAQKNKMENTITEKYKESDISKLFETLPENEKKVITELLNEAQLAGGECATTTTLMCSLKHLDLVESNETLKNYIESLCSINNNSQILEGDKTLNYFVNEGKPAERTKKIKTHTQAVNLLYDIVKESTSQGGKKGGKKTRRKYKKQTNHKKSRKSLFQQKRLNSQNHIRS